MNYTQADERKVFSVWGEIGMAGREMFYEQIALISDPIHNYISFTVPHGSPKEVTEKDIIDSPWVQRLRYIGQLQSARWVYPSAEHSRFVHSLGTMHVAGRFAKQIYPSLKEQDPNCPSFCFIESLLRLTGLLHDIGHGPFCHFFDDHFLKSYQLTHEVVGQVIVLEELAPLLKRIERSISGGFATGERIAPHQIAFLMAKGASLPPLAKKPPVPPPPLWLVMLRPLFSGMFTVDNLDYVLRDAYMCGVATGPVDRDRLMHYTFYTKSGLTLHKSGLPALRMFLNARSYLYSNVYNHRTTRAMDAHLKDIFPETMRELFPDHPLKNRKAYLDLTDWSLLTAIRSWETARSARKKRLFREWQKFLLRDIKWKMAYDATFSLSGAEDGLIRASDFENALRKCLPVAIQNLPLRVDMACQDPRPTDPLMMGDRQVYVYNPSSQSVSKEALMEFIESLPTRVVQCRVFAETHDHDLLLSQAAEEALRSLSNVLKGDKTL